MTAEETAQFLTRINRELGRGSEHRFVEAVFEKRGQRSSWPRGASMHFMHPSWQRGSSGGLKHDLRELLGHGLAKPEDGPCELRFDYIYFTPKSLKLRGVQEMLSKAELERIFGTSLGDIAQLMASVRPLASYCFIRCSSLELRQQIRWLLP